VFCNHAGGPLRRSHFHRQDFKPLLKTAKLPDIRFHDLRHTCATILLSKGVHAKFVQELLGYATIAITMDAYSHVLPCMGGGIADAMDEALR
jgi:integrase